MPAINIDYETADWATVLDPKYRYIFIKGGRSSGKSHEVAAYLADRSVSEVDLKIVCLREIQKSIKRSSKSLIDDKLKLFGTAQFYKSVESEIRKTHPKDDGLFYFSGMNDLTADNIKSLEGFKIAWFEEAQNASRTTLKTLRPTIRAEGSQIIFTWNPKFPDDAIDKFCSAMQGEPDCLIIHVNYINNPFTNDVVDREIEIDQRDSPEDFDHIWLGDYDTSFHGHYYAKLLSDAETDGRVTLVPRKSGVDTITVWDLGRADSTAIWVVQVVGLQVRIIDYYEDRFEDLDVYTDWIKENGYNKPNDAHWLPHDAKHERLGMKGSIESQVKGMGLNNVKSVAIGSIEAGRKLAKTLIKEAYFDKEKCSIGINVLKKERSVLDERTGKWKETHELDGAAAFRYLAQVLSKPKKVTKKKCDMRGKPRTYRR